MAKGEDLELKRRTAAKGGEKCGQESGQEMPGEESKEKGQLPVYQSNRSLREPQLLDTLGLKQETKNSKLSQVEKRTHRPKIPTLLSKRNRFI